MVNFTRMTASDIVRMHNAISHQVSYLVPLYLFTDPKWYHISEATHGLFAHSPIPPTALSISLACNVFVARPARQCDLRPAISDTSHPLCPRHGTQCSEGETAGPDDAGRERMVEWDQGVGTESGGVRRATRNADRSFVAFLNDVTRCQRL